MQQVQQAPTIYTRKKIAWPKTSFDQNQDGGGSNL